MKIVVCLKPVKTSIVFPEDITSSEYMLNPYDTFMLQNIRKMDINNPSVEFIGLMVGPKTAEPVLKRASAYGLDEIYLISDPRIAGADSYATAYVLSKVVETLGNVDYIFCGKKAIDGETGQVPGALAERLGFSIYEDIEKMSFNGIKKQFVGKSVIEDRIYELFLNRQSILVFSDFLLVEPSINLMALKKAKKKPVVNWNLDDINVSPNFSGLKSSKTKILEIDQLISEKSKRHLEEMFIGTLEEKLDYIVEQASMDLLEEVRK